MRRISAGAMPTCCWRTSATPAFASCCWWCTTSTRRRDMVFGLLKEPYRKALFAAATAASSRRAEAHDLAGVSRDHVTEVLAAALTLPGVCSPRLVTFAHDAFWRGETHRLADRPSCIARLLEEAAAAGAEQIILVSAAPESLGAARAAAAAAGRPGRAGRAAGVDRVGGDGRRAAPPAAPLPGRRT